MNPRDPVSEAPSSAPSPGEQLQAARAARGWSTQEVAGRLRIRAELVEALERGDYAPFMAAAYARGQLRNYARLLGLDEAPLLAGFRTLAVDSAGKALYRAPELHPGRPWLVRLGGLAIVGVLAVLGALWAGADRAPQAPAPEAPVAGPAQDTPSAAPPPPAPPEQATPSAEPTPAPPVAESATAPPVLESATASPVAESATASPGTSPDVPAPAAVATAQPDTAPPPAVAQAPAGELSGVELRLRTRAVSWVEVTDHGGQRLIYDLVSPGPERVVRGQPPLRLLLGNAPAVDVVFEGAALALPAGQHVVRMTLGTARPPAPVGTPPQPGATPPAPTP